jgi:DNA mismatch repair ATPase MutL
MSGSDCDQECEIISTPPFAIRRLSKTDSALVVASSALGSVCQVVEELVLNAIDAKAKCIDIKVNMTEFSLEVRDNGELWC